MLPHCSVIFLPHSLAPSASLVGLYPSLSSIFLKKAQHQPHRNSTYRPVATLRHYHPLVSPLYLAFCLFKYIRSVLKQHQLSIPVFLDESKETLALPSSAIRVLSLLSLLLLSTETGLPTLPMQPEARYILSIPTCKTCNLLFCSEADLNLHVLLLPNNILQDSFFKLLSGSWSFS